MKLIKKEQQQLGFLTAQPCKTGKFKRLLGDNEKTVFLLPFLPPPLTSAIRVKEKGLEMEPRTSCLRGS